MQNASFPHEPGKHMTNPLQKRICTRVREESVRATIAHSVGKLDFVFLSVWSSSVTVACLSIEHIVISDPLEGSASFLIDSSIGGRVVIVLVCLCQLQVSTGSNMVNWRNSVRNSSRKLEQNVP